MATVFDCDWEDGSDILNTGGTSVWDSETDANSKLSEDQTSLMWGTDCLRYVCSGAVGTAFLRETITAIGQCGIRIGFKPVSESLADTESVYFSRCQTGGTDRIRVRLIDDAGTIKLEVLVRDSAAAYQSVGTVAISLNTSYQMVIKWQQNTAGGCAFKVYAQDGTTLIGTEQTLGGGITTANLTFSIVDLGCPIASSLTINYGMDIFQVINTYAYPDTIVSGGGLSIPVAMHHYNQMRA